MDGPELASMIAHRTRTRLHLNLYLDTFITRLHFT